MKDGRSILIASMLVVTNAGAFADEFANGLADYRSDDPAGAYEHWRICAGEGVASCQYGLGVLYDVGAGVTQDSYEALTWYQRAAGQDYPEAFMQLGFLYSIGRPGISQSAVRSWAWFARAAAAGVPKGAQHRDRVGAMLTEQELLEAQKLADELSIRYHLQE